VDDLFRLGVTNAAWATALALVATAGAWFCRRRPAVVHALWILVLIKLLMPSLTRVDLPVAAAVGPVAATELAAVSLPSGARSSVRAHVAEGEHRTTAGRTSHVSAPATTEVPHTAVIARPLRWQAAVMLLWSVGAMVWWAIVIRSASRFHRLARSSRPASAELVDRASRVATRLGLRHVPTIGLVPARVPPLLWASFTCAPRLFLPEELWARFDSPQQDAVLAHELAHWKRRDHWVRRLEAIVLGLYWWYPGAWWARRQLERAEEECCDAWVVWALPSAALAYAEALVATAAFLSGLRQPLLVGASGAGRNLPLKRRLRMILQHQSANSHVRSVPRLVLVAGALTLPFLPEPAPGQQAGAPGSVAPASVQPPAAPANATTLPVKTGGKASEAAFVVKFKEIVLDPKKPDEKVRVCQPIVRDVSDYVETQGHLAAAHTVQLRPRVSGMIVNVYCRLGQIVNLGDPLFQIDERLYRIEWDKAEATVQRAQARMKRWTNQLARVSEQVKTKVVGEAALEEAESEFGEAEASFRAATADRDLAKFKLDSTKVRAPIAGNLSGSILDAGSVVTADATVLARVVALDPMYVVFHVDEETALLLKNQGKKQANPVSAPTVMVGLSGENGFPRNTPINVGDLTIDVVGNAARNEVRCRAPIPNHDGILFPGLTARVRVVTSTPHSALLVPVKAINYNRQSPHVDVVTATNTLESRAVQLGLDYDGMRAVKAGLRAGDWIIAEAPDHPFQ
jgi:RND family efflux transporter MFP subunit